MTHPIAFAVFARNHTTIHGPDEETQHAEWEKTLLDSLSVTPSDYAVHIQNCRNLTAATFAAHPDDANFHQYMHVVFRLRDQFGADITVRKRNLEGTCPGWVDAQMRLESHRKLH